MMGGMFKMSGGAGTTRMLTDCSAVLQGFAQAATGAMEEKVDSTYANCIAAMCKMIMNTKDAPPKV